MATPLRLLTHSKDSNSFQVFHPTYPLRYDILSYTWRSALLHEDDNTPPPPPYDTGIEGISWRVKVHPLKLAQIKAFMISSGIQYLWVDALCINQDDEVEVAGEMEKMYYYYTGADRCHVLLDMEEAWDPHAIVEELRFVDHIMGWMGGSAVAGEAKLTENMAARMKEWSDAKEWGFEMDKSAVRAAGFEPGVVNCYATNVKRVQELFDHLYFGRVWTFQEMLLGKNVMLWTVGAPAVEEKIDVRRIGELDVWMDLASDAADKAVKLFDWISKSRVIKSAAVFAILGLIGEDILILADLRTQVRGIASARTDIISGGPRWWVDNHMGVANVFSAISFRERKATVMHDTFRGLLGIFQGLFTPEEMRTHLTGTDMNAMSFAFFQQLSVKTKQAWTRLVTSSGERGSWDWIPVVANHNRPLTTDVFSGVVHLGRLKPDGMAKVEARTGIVGTPKKYATLTLRQETGNPAGMRFTFRGCNCGKKLKTGLFSKEIIPTLEPARVSRDQTGRTLVHCATLLGAILDPAGDMAEFKRRLLKKLEPWWTVTDRNAKLAEWWDRAVSGTGWADPTREKFRVHNRSIDVHMEDIYGCSSRMYNETTKSITCELTIDQCGCKITGPFALVMEAISAVEGGVLGGQMAASDPDGRIILRDGLGLAQVGDINRPFHLIAFQGKVETYKSYSARCRSTKKDNPVPDKIDKKMGREPWPKARALVRADFKHEFTDVARDYGYVATGAGNLLICRNHPMDKYRVVGVCIDGPVAMDVKSSDVKGVTVR
ncbi:heterokaryon incompatibility protein 6, OR allele [Podospora aff. communis PSN243]|uniref:Heterokaryon incompatibility protein 6, OR allele n=1 Tax=Podospora aff. communis PSN243 TaxID=3040156 RepID=A0AAV9GVF1_9PEZI|nr:heterokaryon incompatibility protein 6, OR allele [Podospora aff. communis PSN243]